MGAAAGPRAVHATRGAPSAPVAAGCGALGRRAGAPRPRTVAASAGSPGYQQRVAGGERSRLRAQGQDLVRTGDICTVHLGKAGTGPAFHASLGDALEGHEFVRVKVGNLFDADLRDVIRDVEREVDCVCLLHVGFTFIVYRKAGLPRVAPAVAGSPGAAGGEAPRGAGEGPSGKGAPRDPAGRAGTKKARGKRGKRAGGGAGSGGEPGGGAKRPPAFTVIAEATE